MYHWGRPTTSGRQESSNHQRHLFPLRLYSCPLAGSRTLSVGESSILIRRARITVLPTSVGLLDDPAVGTVRFGEAVTVIGGAVVAPNGLVWRFRPSRELAGYAYFHYY